MTVDVEKWPYLKDVDIHDLDNATPTIMIGEDNLHVKRFIQQITGKVGTPFATLTPLGWMVHGPDEWTSQQRRIWIPANNIGWSKPHCKITDLTPPPKSWTSWKRACRK